MLSANTLHVAPCPLRIGATGLPVELREATNIVTPLLSVVVAGSVIVALPVLSIVGGDCCKSDIDPGVGLGAGVGLGVGCKATMLNGGSVRFETWPVLLTPPAKLPMVTAFEP